MNADQLRTRADVFAADVVRFCKALRTDRTTSRLADQLQDAGTSVAANYHAACRARSRAEFISKLCTVVEEADEAVLWLATLKRTALVEGPELDRLLEEASELLAIFAASRRTAIRRRAKAGADRKE